MQPKPRPRQGLHHEGGWGVEGGRENSLELSGLRFLSGGSWSNPARTAL